MLQRCTWQPVMHSRGVPTAATSSDAERWGYIRIRIIRIRPWWWPHVARLEVRAQLGIDTVPFLLVRGAL